MKQWLGFSLRNYWFYLWRDLHRLRLIVWIFKVKRFIESCNGCWLRILHVLAELRYLSIGNVTIAHKSVLMVAIHRAVIDFRMARSIGRSRVIDVIGHRIAE